MSTEIQAINKKFMDAASQADAAGMAAVYTENGQVLPPGGETVTGKEAIEAFWQGTLETLGLKFVQLNTVELEHFGNSAYEVGQALLYGEGEQLLAEVKFVVIWKRENGEWRWHRDIFNMNA